MVSVLEVSDSFLTSDTSFKTFVFSLASVPFRRAEETVSARHRTYNSPSKQLVSEPKINVFLPWLKLVSEIIALFFLFLKQENPGRELLCLFPEV